MRTVRQSEQYAMWFEGLRDRHAQARIVVRIERLANGNPGSHRVLTGGVVELKIDVGPGYRVYCTHRSAELILLLAGGDKSSQARDIELALKLAKEA